MKCPVCRREMRVSLTKIGRPMFKCGPCMLIGFVNAPEAVDAVVRKRFRELRERVAREHGPERDTDGYEYDEIAG